MTPFMFGSKKTHIDLTVSSEMLHHSPIDFCMWKLIMLAYLDVFTIFLVLHYMTISSVVVQIEDTCIQIMRMWPTHNMRMYTNILTFQKYKLNTIKSLFFKKAFKKKKNLKREVFFYNVFNSQLGQKLPEQNIWWAW